MKAFKRILVALDFSPMDDRLIRYSFWISRRVGAEKIYFIYCARELRNFKEDFLEEHNEIPRDESIRHHLSKIIEKHKTNTVLEYEIIVDQVKPLKGLLYWQDVKKADLLIVGKKKYSSGSGVISRQFVRQNDCPVLFVPEEATESMNNILVPIDFSQNSQYALQTGIELQLCFDRPEIICLHVYLAVPEYYGGHETETYGLLRKKLLTQKYSQFIAPYQKNKKINPHFIAENDFKAIPIIIKHAEENDSGLIVIGAIGHSKLKLLTVGSTAEKMMLSDFKVPLLVIRK